VNVSIRSFTFPTAYKDALATPIIKEPTLDPDQLFNYRPVSNLRFESKILEKAVLCQLEEYQISNNLIETYQSTCRPGHSTETATLHLQNDILQAIDDRQCVFLVLLDLQAAFDTASHDILLKRLESRFGIQESVLKWITSYLSHRSQAILVDGRLSSPAELKYGIPQGSVLGPVLFTDYISPVSPVAKDHDVPIHYYTDDTQLHKSFTSGVNVAAALNGLGLALMLFSAG